MKVSLITGPEGYVQGWGTIQVTEKIQQALSESEIDSEIIFVSNMSELQDRLNSSKPDLAWSSLYFLSDNSEYIGSKDNKWVVDLLEDFSIPYIGGSKNTLERLLTKSACQERLQSFGIPIPEFYLIKKNEPIPLMTNFPYLIKPDNEANSRGISDSSVVYNSKDLKEKVFEIQELFHQPAFVEEYLPGKEITISAIGNGEKIILPLEINIKEEYKENHSLLTHDVKKGGLKNGKVALFKPSKEEIAITSNIASRTCDALEIQDWTRMDTRKDKNGNFKVFDVNGIPGLSNIGSYQSIAFYTYYPTISKKEVYDFMINTIVGKGLSRHGLPIPNRMRKKMLL
jgi:D-alanine-D-alanine ligase